MKLDGEKLRGLFRMKAKFAMTGAVATTVDYVVYLVLVARFFSPVVSNIISYSCGMVINFLLQKRFVFVLQGSPYRAFGLSLGVSLGGMALSTGIIYGLTQLEFFSEHQYITKLCATGMVFFYNFYLKRYVFERKFI
ncbi:MAG: GtrA family protein [Phaeodactylibacter sp.]|nr:GtrA family protein [Phaeodactylibacter sp.]MCB9298432.1 GtrA family protein [Lewinellaceae bacterium]